jgi:N-acetyl-gamma-glutamyl-phosphate reductase
MAVKKVAVVGGAGYVGIELVRCLLGHPGFELLAVTSDGDADRPLAELYPALLGRTELSFVGHDALDAIGATGATGALDAVFLAVPHTAAMGMVPDLLARGISVFDLSADFRLKDAAVYERWYGVEHVARDLLASALYGLPEFNRELLSQGLAGQGLAGQGAASALPQGAALVACPGCYPTASALAVVPALSAGLADEGPVIINAISGVSGAGRAPQQNNSFCQANENVNAYGVATHRHSPEIAQTLSEQAARPVRVVFTPHLAPLTRGLLATATFALRPGVDAAALVDAYEGAYGDGPFVRVLPYGVMPRTASVVGTNNAQVGIKLDEENGMLIASCAIDNLGKGAASQAIQCANLVFGFDEGLGLDASPRPL